MRPRPGSIGAQLRPLHLKNCALHGRIPGSRAGAPAQDSGDRLQKDLQVQAE